jgi:AcrR family transcriptional regulator
MARPLENTSTGEITPTGHAARAEPELDAKQRPVMRRSINTFELILSTAAELLAEVGIERLSTNLICQRAGLTPPALYRYFPNKYAVLKELGSRLMAHINEAILAWLRSDQPLGPLDLHEASARSLIQITETVNAITQEYPAAGWIMRALRAVPALTEVRLAAQRRIAEAVFEALRDRYPLPSDAELRVATRLATEVLLYLATELVIDDPLLDREAVNAQVAEMVVGYFRKFR